MKVEKVTIQHFSIGDGRICEDGTLHEKTLPFYSFVQSVEGKYELEIEGAGAFCCNESEIFIAPPFRKQRIVHRISANGAMRMRWIFVEPFINEKPMEQCLLLPSLVPDSIKSEATELFDGIFSSDSQIRKQGLFFLLLDRLVSAATPCITDERDIIADDVKQMLCSEYSNPELKIVDIANRLFVSRATVYRLFSDKIGMSPMAYLNRIRMERAAYLLAATDDSISLVGEAVGLPDQSYFSKLFKAEFRVSPREYRRTALSYLTQ